MATLVRNRPFQKRKNNNIKKQIRKIKLIYPSVNFSVKWLWVFILFVIFSYWAFFIIKNTIFKADNYIEKISYSQTSVNNYDDPYLYKKISELIKYENYFVVSKFKKWDILRTLQDEFPMVKNIKIIQPQKFSASVRIGFYEPDIIVKLGDRKFGVLWDFDFEIFTWNSIGNWSFSVELPQYASWISSIHWLFFEISPEKLIYAIEVISQWI